MKILLAALAAVLVQPLVLIVRLAPVYLSSAAPFYGVGLMFVAVIVVATATAVLLGIPAFLILKRFGHLSWTSASITGTLLGGLPVAFFWPQEREGYSAGHNWHGTYVDTYINGIPTNYAWLSYGESVLTFALHGLIGALVFYAVWRRCNRLN